MIEKNKKRKKQKKQKEFINKNLEEESRLITNKDKIYFLFILLNIKSGNYKKIFDKFK